MRQLVAATVTLALLAVAGFSTTPAVAAADAAAPITATPTMELIVVEAPGCIYCDMFRRDILPAYAASGNVVEVPIRFVDINDDSAKNLELDAPIEMVPTFLLVKNNREVGRIPGFTGSDTFFQSVKTLIRDAD